MAFIGNRVVKTTHQTLLKCAGELLQHTEMTDIKCLGGLKIGGTHLKDRLHCNAVVDVGYTESTEEASECHRCATCTSTKELVHSCLKFSGTFCFYL